MTFILLRRLCVKLADQDGLWIPRKVTATSCASSRPRRACPSELIRLMAVSIAGSRTVVGLPLLVYVDDATSRFDAASLRQFGVPFTYFETTRGYLERLYGKPSGILRQQSVFRINNKQTTGGVARLSFESCRHEQAEYLWYLCQHQFSQGAC